MEVGMTRQWKPIIIGLVTVLSSPGSIERLPADAQASAAIQQFGGAMQAHALIGDVLFIGKGPTIVRYTRGADNELIATGVSSVLPGVVRSLATDGDRLFAALGLGGVCVLHSAILDLHEMSCKTFSGPALDIAALDTEIAIAQSSAGIRHLRFVNGSLEDHGELRIGTAVEKVAIGAQFAIAMSTHSFAVLDIAGPRPPRLVGTFDAGQRSILYAVALSGSRVYVGIDFQVVSVSIEDPEHPKEESFVSLSITRGGKVSDILIRDGILWVTTYSRGPENGGVWQVEDAQGRLRLIKYLLSQLGMVGVEVIEGDIDKCTLALIVSGSGIGVASVRDRTIRITPFLEFGDIPKSIESVEDVVVTSGIGGIVIRRYPDLEVVAQFSDLADAVGVTKQPTGTFQIIMGAHRPGVAESYLSVFQLIGSDLTLLGTSESAKGIFTDIAALESDGYAGIVDDDDHGGVGHFMIDTAGRPTWQNKTIVSKKGVRRIRATNNKVLIAGLDGGLSILDRTIGDQIKTIAGFSPEYVVDGLLSGTKLVIAQRLPAFRGGIVSICELAGTTCINEPAAIQVSGDPSSIDIFGSKIVLGMTQWGEHLAESWDDVSELLVLDSNELTVISSMEIPGRIQELKVIDDAVLIAAEEGGLYHIKIEEIPEHPSQSATPTVFLPVVAR
jgi:hypothetical protein